MAADCDPLSLLSPEYPAVIECVPTVNVVAVNCAAPPTTVPLPRKFPLSKNATVPVAAEGVTVAVNVTLPPAGIVVADAVTTVVVLVNPLPAGFTISCTGPDCEPL
jgi:hypothetical protein